MCVAYVSLACLVRNPLGDLQNQLLQQDCPSSLPGLTWLCWVTIVWAPPMLPRFPYTPTIAPKIIEKNKLAWASTFFTSKKLDHPRKIEKKVVKPVEPIIAVQQSNFKELKTLTYFFGQSRCASLLSDGWLLIPFSVNYLTLLSSFLKSEEKS